MEYILNTAVRLGKVSTRNTNDMLKTMSYKGMKQNLRDLCGYLYHSIQDFDMLRVEVRMIEMDHPTKSTLDKPKQATTKSVSVLLFIS